MLALLAVTYLLVGFARLLSSLPDYDLPVIGHRVRILDVCGHVLLWPYPLTAKLLRGPRR
jgi:hypothetical protein